MSFRDITGQDRAVDFLQSSVINGTVSHAYIFTGPSGIGKKLTALNFAKALNCLDPKDGASCDLCAQCKKIDSSNHPDVLVLAPDKEEKSLGIDKIRVVTRDIGLKPYEARRKVYVLDNAGSMRHEAANALLKTLEEPVSDSVLILITEDMNSLFATIQSRAKRVRFFPLSAEAIEKILTVNYKMDAEKARILSRISSGEISKALKYNEGGFLEKRRRVLNALKAGELLDADLDGLSKPELRLVLDVILAWYRDMLIAKSGARDSAAFVNIDDAGAVCEGAKRVSFQELNDAINQVILTESSLDENVNTKLAMGVLGIRLTHS